MPRTTARSNAGLPSALGASFHEDVARVVLQLRSALTGVFSALGKPIRGGTDLQRELGLPGTLSWQLHGVINAPDPITAACQIPGRQASKRALAAAASKGVPADVIDRAARAFDEFEACVERHTGSRAAFASMVSSLASADSSSLDLKARRDAYRADTHIYGVQLATSFNTFIFHPSKSGDGYDFVFVHGLVGLRLLRAFDKLFVARHHSDADNPGAPRLSLPLPVLDPLEDLSGTTIPVVTEFSSSPLPRFSSEGGVTTDRELYITGQPVGRTGELTFFFAELWPGAVPRGEVLNCDAAVVHPTEQKIHDVLIHSEVARAHTAPTTAAFGGPLHELRRKYRAVDRVEINAQSSLAGTGIDALQTAAAPRYVELLGRICERLGWNPTSFDAYRCQVEYPVLHSLINVAFPLKNPESAR